jgi:uncharacterized protein (DUF302 family)
MKGAAAGARESPVITIRNGAATAKITIHKLRGNVSILEGSGGNITVLTGRDGKVLVDAGISRPPTDLIIFGNARGGTPLMQSAQTAGIDLPLKILVWQDAANNKTWISYNEPSRIAQLHGVAGAESTIDKMADLLKAIAREASGSR